MSSKETRPYPTPTALQSKVKAIVVPLGVRAHFRFSDYAMDLIHEGDWHDKVAELWRHVDAAR